MPKGGMPPSRSCAIRPRPHAAPAPITARLVAKPPTAVSLREAPSAPDLGRHLGHVEALSRESREFRTGRFRKRFGGDGHRQIPAEAFRGGANKGWVIAVVRRRHLVGFGHGTRLRGPVCRSNPPTAADRLRRSPCGRSSRRPLLLYTKLVGHSGPGRLRRMPEAARRRRQGAFTAARGCGSAS